MRKIAALLLPAVFAMTGCKEARPCDLVIPAASEESDPAFFAWLALQAKPVDYTGSANGGWWIDGTGEVIGVSAQEDSEICAWTI